MIIGRQTRLNPDTEDCVCLVCGARLMRVESEIEREKNQVIIYMIIKCVCNVLGLFFCLTCCETL
jgi:hypothetical protein